VRFVKNKITKTLCTSIANSIALYPTRGGHIPKLGRDIFRYWLWMFSNLSIFGIFLNPGIFSRFDMPPPLTSKPLRPPGVSASMASITGQSSSVSSGRWKVGIFMSPCAK